MFGYCSEFKAQLSYLHLFLTFIAILLKHLKDYQFIIRTFLMNLIMKLYVLTSNFLLIEYNKTSNTSNV